MKEITNYITEKFRISKKTKSNTLYEGGKVCIVSLHKYKDSSEVELKLYSPFILTKLDEEYEELTYKVPNTGREISWIYYINSHNIYQQKDYDDKESTIYLSFEDMKEFLNILLKERVFNPKYGQTNFVKILKDRYFDDIKKLDIENNTLVYLDFGGSNVIYHFERPKDVKDFINKYYTEKN